MTMIQHVPDITVGTEVKFGYRDEWKTVAAAENYRWGEPATVFTFTDGSYRVVKNSALFASRNYL